MKTHTKHNLTFAWLKTMQLPAICIISILAFAVSSCKKSASNPTYNFNGDGLSYVQLQQGHYFIYKDSTTSKADSIVVTTSAVSSFTATADGLTYNAQMYTLVLSAANSGGAVWLTGTANSAFNSTALYLVLPAEEGGYLFRYPADAGTSIPSMTVEGKTYTNIISTSNYFSAMQYSSYYWAKGVGLIKDSETVGGVTITYTLLRHN